MSFSVEELREKALDLGWDDMGITHATISAADVEAYRQWVSAGYHGKMKYMENEMRCSPQAILPGAQTALLFVSNYKQESVPVASGKGLIASYARGRDYHHLHRKRLKRFIAWLEERTGQKNIARGFSDSTPMLEKALAVQAGLGWFGKNTLLIHRRFGTFILLSGILTTLTLPHTEQTMEMRIPRCGSCTRCLDACPTQAFVSPYQLDATRCLSYHLIESKESIPEEIQRLNPGWGFGCDICQNVCPHNLKKPISLNPSFSPEKGTGTFLTHELLEELQQHPEKLYGTPLQRKGVAGLLANLQTLTTAKAGQ